MFVRDVNLITRGARKVNINLWNTHLINGEFASGYIGDLNCANHIMIRPANRCYWLDVRDINGHLTVKKVQAKSNQDKDPATVEILLEDK